jgi:hypothetical protein
LRKNSPQARKGEGARLQSCRKKRRAAPSLLPQARFYECHPERSAATGLASGERAQSARRNVTLSESTSVGKSNGRRTPEAERTLPARDPGAKGNRSQSGPNKIGSGAPAPRKARAWRKAPTAFAWLCVSERRTPQESPVNGHDFSRPEKSGAQRLPCCRRPAGGVR